jgi:uncharacterized low-complexity protein
MQRARHDGIASPRGHARARGPERPEAGASTVGVALGTRAADASGGAAAWRRRAKGRCAQGRRHEGQRGIARGRPEGGRDAEGGVGMIRKLASGQYRLFSRKKDPRTGKRRNLGTFATRAAAERHERAVQFFKRH